MAAKSLTPISEALNGRIDPNRRRAVRPFVIRALVVVALISAIVPFVPTSASAETPSQGAATSAVSCSASSGGNWWPFSRRSFSCAFAQAPVLKSEREVCVRNVATDEWLTEVEWKGHRGWYDVATSDRAEATTWTLLDYDTHIQLRSTDTDRFLDWDRRYHVDTAWSQGTDTHWTMKPLKSGNVALFNEAGRSALTIGWWGNVSTTYWANRYAEWDITEGPCVEVEIDLDLDDDGFEGHLGNNTDCDDTNPLINPDAQEIPGNNIDEDCLNGDALGAMETPTVSAVTTTSLTLTWQRPPGGTGDITYVVLVLSDIGEILREAQDLQATTVDITDLTPGATYELGVIAETQGSSSFSSVVTTTNPPVEPEPTPGPTSDVERLIAEAAANNLTTLDLSNLGLTELPDTIGQLTSLDFLSLDNNELTNLPDSIGQLTNLQYLSLYNNELTELPDSIGNLTDLDSLDLQNNQLTQLPDSIGNLADLDSLLAGNNRLTELPETIGQLTNLQYLSLYDNELAELPTVITQLTNLIQLELADNQLIELPDTITQLTNLQYLSLSSNPIGEIPATVAQLTSLTQLEISTLQLTELPDTIGQLTNLQYLGLGDNELTELPAVITQLTNLQSLSLYNNQLTEVPDTIGQLTNLQFLDVSQNQLTELPGIVTQLTNLTQLAISDNQLTELPATIGQLTNLEGLNIEGNQLAVFPVGLTQLTNLQYLVISRNRLTELPSTIGQLTNLTQLYLYNNQLTELPDTIGQLTNLTQLEISSNQLTELPDTIGQLTNLDYLAIFGNPLPESLLEAVSTDGAEGFRNWLANNPA